MSATLRKARLEVEYAKEASRHLDSRVRYIRKGYLKEARKHIAQALELLRQAESELWDEIAPKGPAPKKKAPAAAPPKRRRRRSKK